MNTIVSRDELHRTLSIVSRAVAGKTALPILSYVLIRAEGDRLILTGTDLTAGLRTHIPAAVTTPGAIALDARILVEWLGSIRSDVDVEIDVDMDRFRATFRVAGARITLAGLDPEDYPVVPEIASGDVAFTAGGVRCRRMINRTVVATALDELRPVLHGVRIHVTSERMSMAAADGFRMAVDEAEYATGAEGEITAIVPREAIMMLAGLIDDETREITFALVEPQRSMLAARVGDVEWMSRLVGGAFPDVVQLIRRDHAATVEVDRKELRQSVRGSRSLSKANKDITILGVDDEALRIAADSFERGDSDATIPAQIEVLDEAFERTDRRLNWRYLDDALGSLESETITLAFGPSNTVSVQVYDPVNPGYVSVIMAVLPS